jgi:hypothetical protein
MTLALSHPGVYPGVFFESAGFPAKLQGFLGAVSGFGRFFLTFLSGKWGKNGAKYMVFW